MDSNLILLQSTLSFMFTFIMYKVEDDGTESFKSLKTTKKSFLQKLSGEKIRVKVVDDYPEKFEDNVMYVRKNGKTVWYRENHYKG